MNQSTKTSILLSALATVYGCSENSARIDDDGIYSGELTSANRTLDDDDSAYAEHKIDLALGEELDLTMQSADFDAYLHVLDAAGNVIGQDDDSAGGTNANLIVIAPETATYTIVANAFSAEEYGEYILSVRRQTSDNAGDVFTGVLDEVDGKSFSTNSYPTHEVVASAGEVLEVHLTSGAFDTYVEVMDSSGNILAEDDDGAGGTNSRVSVPVWDDGTYTVVVKSFGDGEGGAYTLIVRNDPADASSDERVERLSGQLMSWNDRLDDGTPYELHVIDATAGEELEIDMSSSAFDAYLQLWAEDESIIATDDDSGGGLNSKVNFLVPSDGQYTIVANSVGEDATGSYNITVRRRSLDAQLASGNMEILTGSLSSLQDLLADGTPASSHEIQASAGDHLEVSMMAGEFDAYLLVFDNDDNKLSEDDDSGGGTNARLSVIAPTDGTYRVVANSYTEGATGPYTITVRRD